MEKKPRDRLDINKLMKRPSMSEFDESLHRANKRTTNSLNQQHYWNDMVIKVRHGETQLHDHTRKQKEFALEMNNRLSGGRKSSASSGWQRVRENRLSLPNIGLGQQQPVNRKGGVQRRRSSVTTLLSDQGRVVKIRQRLYREFKVGEMNASRKISFDEPRPPDSRKSSLTETQKIQLMGQRRKLSEPNLPLTDKLNEDLECRLQSIIEGLRTMSARKSPEIRNARSENSNSQANVEVLNIKDKEPNEIGEAREDNFDADSEPLMIERPERKQRRHSTVTQPARNLLNPKGRRYSEGHPVMTRVQEEATE